MKSPNTVAKKAKKTTNQTVATGQPTPAAEPAAAAIPVQHRPSSKAKRNGATPAPKPSAPRAAKPRQKAAASKGVEPTNEEIQLRAYFISERRHRLGLPGDTTSDWVEARGQLLSEAAPR